MLVRWSLIEMIKEDPPIGFSEQFRPVVFKAIALSFINSSLPNIQLTMGNPGNYECLMHIIYLHRLKQLDHTHQEFHRKYYCKFVEKLGIDPQS